MSELSINNGLSVKNDVSFQGKKEKVADNKSSNDEGMKTSTKLMLGATALAAAVAGVIKLKNANTAKKAFQEGFNHVEQTPIKDTQASNFANDMIDRVERLKCNEGSKDWNLTRGKNCIISSGPNRAEKQKILENIDWDAKPISRNQALFEEKFNSNRARIPYINPEYEKEIVKFEELGGKVKVKDLENGKKEITYIYPEDSVFESKTVIGKVADIEKGHNYADYDEKFVGIKLKDSEGGHTYGLVLRNNFKLSDGGLYEIRYDGATQWGFIKPEDVFDKATNGWIKAGNLSNQSEKAVSRFFQKELGLI